jgi:NADH-quinone oxidoreductase subunit K
MANVPLQHAMFLAIALFALGLAGVLVRRNFVFILMSIEIMLNAAGLAFIIAGARWGQADGQVVFLFILSLAAAEVAIGLALILRIRARLPTLDADAANWLQG